MDAELAVRLEDDEETEDAETVLGVRGREGWELSLGVKAVEVELS